MATPWLGRCAGVDIYGRRCRRLARVMTRIADRMGWLVVGLCARHAKGRTTA